MSYANNQGIRIHYETEGQGPPLVLRYGHYFPLDVWYELNYVRALKDHFRLILVDSRGHGDSDKPYDPAAYRTELMVQDILCVLDDLGIEKTHYMGYSSGAFVGFGIAKYAQNRVHSLILGGSYPYSSDMDLGWDEDQVKTLEKQTTVEFVDGLEKFLISQNFSPFSPHMKTRMLTHDLRALIAWHRANLSLPAFDDLAGSITVPCLIYAGDQSGEYAKARRAAQEIPGAVFVGIPNGGHLEGGTWIEQLKPHILKITGRA